LWASFACPSLGIKVDAYPGRLNQVSVYLNREGVFYGRTSTAYSLKHGDSCGRREGGWNYACASHLICIFIKIPYTIRRTIGSSARAWSGGELAGKASSHSQIVSNGIRAQARGFAVVYLQPHFIRWNSTNNVDSELEIKHPEEAALKSKGQPLNLNRGCSANFARFEPPVPSRREVRRV
jgi:hypothetical protein